MGCPTSLRIFHKQTTTFASVRLPSPPPAMSLPVRDGNSFSWLYAPLPTIYHFGLIYRDRCFL